MKKADLKPEVRRAIQNLYDGYILGFERSMPPRWVLDEVDDLGFPIQQERPHHDPPNAYVMDGGNYEGKFATLAKKMGFKKRQPQENHERQ